MKRPCKDERSRALSLESDPDLDGGIFLVRASEDHSKVRGQGTVRTQEGRVGPTERPFPLPLSQSSLSLSHVYTYTHMTVCAK